MTYDYNSIYRNSTSGERLRTKKQKREQSKKKRRKQIASLLTLAMIVAGSVHVGLELVDKISRDKKLADANEYMRTKIVTYLENSDLNYAVLKDKILIENDQKKLEHFADLLEKDGFSRHEVFYMISQIGDKVDKKEFDNIVKTSGYDDSQDFLYDNYKKGVLSSSGDSYIQTWGDMKVFENNVELDYVESVDELIEKEENKGLNR